MRRFVTAVAIATAAAFAATACSSTIAGQPTHAASHSVPIAPTTSSQPATSSNPSPNAPLTNQQAQAALLTAAEVGGGFTARPSGGTGAPLCDQHAPPLDQQFPPSGKARIEFIAPGGVALFGEEVLGYDSVTTTDQALAAGERALACRTATIHTQVNGKRQAIQYRIQPAIDVTNLVPVTVDKALRWVIRTDSHLYIQEVVTKIGANIVVLTFAAATNADTSHLASPATVLGAALRKAKAHF